MFLAEPLQDKAHYSSILFKRFTFLVFRASVRDFDVSLWPNRDVYAPGVVFEHVTSEGPQPIPYDMGTFYKGQVKGACVCRNVVTVCMCSCMRTVTVLYSACIIS